MYNLKLIIAIDKNGVMGFDNKLPLKLSDDLKHFKKETAGSPLIMGSKTFKSLPGILPYREHIVLSNTLESDENISVFTSIKHILEYIKEYNKSYLIGGANLINQFVKLNLIDELIITHVDTEIKTYDTILDLNFLDKWSIYSNTKFEKNAVNEYSFSICKYILNKKRFYY